MRVMAMSVSLAAMAAGCVAELGPDEPMAEAADQGVIETAVAAPAPRPPMGWNSWNRFGCRGINERLIREIADALVSSGLAAAGYDTLTIDDCWSAKTRNGAGDLQSEPSKFAGGMKALGDHVHGKGLRYGIYASIGTATCTGKTPGSVDLEARDVRTFAAWGVDYIKADRCNADGLVLRDVFGRWRAAIAAVDRPIVLSASDNGGREEPWSWGPVTAQQWRTTGDIRDTWERMLSTFDGNARHPAATAPGTYNDPDMLEIGNGGMSDLEYRTHMGLWALASAPLIAGHDVRSMSAAAKAILTHREVLDVDQDALGFQAVKVRDLGGGLQVWAKPIAASGGRAVGLLNRSGAAATLTVDWRDLGLGTGAATVRDLWARANRGSFTGRYGVQVPAHGLALLRIVGAEPGLVTGFVSDQPWSYAASEWGPVERDRSNGERGTGDGRTITLNGTTHAKGLGVHAPAAVELRPDGACSTFTADVGVDDEVGDRGSVRFQVWTDGRKVYDSGTMTGATATRSVRVDLAGVTSLRLQVVGVDTSAYDHADWASARVTCGS